MKSLAASTDDTFIKRGEGRVVGFDRVEGDQLTVRKAWVNRAGLPQRKRLMQIAQITYGSPLITADWSLITEATDSASCLLFL